MCHPVQTHSSLIRDLYRSSKITPHENNKQKSQI